MANSCKETLAVRVMVAVQIALAIFTLIMWSQLGMPLLPRHDQLENVVTVRCRNLLPERTAAVLNGVVVPAGAVRGIPISRATLNLSIQLVVTCKPLNQALNEVVTVQVSPEFLNAPTSRLQLALEYMKRRSYETGSVRLTSPSAILAYFGFRECPPSLE